MKRPHDIRCPHQQRGDTPECCKTAVAFDATMAERERCAKIAQHATIPPYSFQIHPDIPFDKFNESAKMAAHSCAQGIAAEIRTPTA